MKGIFQYPKSNKKANATKSRQSQIEELCNSQRKQETKCRLDYVHYLSTTLRYLQKKKEIIAALRLNLVVSCLIQYVSSYYNFHYTSSFCTREVGTTYQNEHTAEYHVNNPDTLGTLHQMIPLVRVSNKW